GSPGLEVVRDLNASLRPILDGGGKPDSSPAPRRLLARVDGHLELGLVLRRGERSSREKAGGDDEEADFAFHGYTFVRCTDYNSARSRWHRAAMRSYAPQTTSAWPTPWVINGFEPFQEWVRYPVKVAPNMTCLGQKRKYAVQKGMSAFPPKADMSG